MNQFLLQKGSSKELEQFAHIIEFGIKKNNSFQFFAVDESINDCLRIYYVLEGKFEWTINDCDYILYPGDLVLIQPGCTFSRQSGVLDIGKLCWIFIELEKTKSPEGIMLGKWTSFPANEILTIGKIFRLCNTPVISRIKEAERILAGIRYEIFYQQVGYVTRTNQLIDELLILLARKLTLHNNTHRDFPKSFLNLEQTLRQNLSHQWTVEEMAALVGLGTTTFTEKVKSYSGFTPLNYLITIRISEAIRLLKQNNLSVTDIALDVGFYSSQHFSTTFKKLTGSTPSEFRKKNISNEQD
jgi:AraC-like DNA-binding protein